jgi:ubiquinone/menaquinone biosynthesis C-methylase UbiE
MTQYIPPVAQYYDRFSDVYDEASSVHGAWTPPEFMKQEIIAFKHKIHTALIVGIGTGHDIEALKLKQIKHIEGIDISSGMLAKAKVKHPEIILHHADFITYDNFKKEKYDLIICSGTVEFIPDFSGFFEKISHMLTKNGRLLLTYEPVILNHAIQKDRQSETVPTTSSHLYVPGFMNYRRPVTEFLEQVKKNNFTLENFFEFVAYRKKNIDIIYHFARLSASCPQ